MLDFHNHLIPGVDDGALTLEESRQALKTLSDQGFSAVITTPHLSASTLMRAEGPEYLARVDARWTELKQLAQREFSAIRLERGVELLLDAPLSQITDSRVRLAQTEFVLVEFPWTGIPVNAAKILFDLKMNGYTPVVAHPERYQAMDSALSLAEEWTRGGAVLQVNAGSLVGQYGGRPQTLAWRLLARGLASYIGSDFHARGQCLSRIAMQALEKIGADDVATLLFDTNPHRLIEGLQPLDVRQLPSARTKWWRSLLPRTKSR